MSSLALPDLGAAPGACRDLARSAEHVTHVDRALACVCAAAPAPPTLLDRPLLGPTLCDHPPEVARHAETGSDRAVRGGPAPSMPAHRVEPPHRVEAPEGAARPAPRDGVPAPRPTASADCAPVPAPRRLRRRPPECPPEPPAARAVREDPACRVGTAQLRALAGDLPARTGERSSRPVPPAGTGTRAAVPPTAEKLSGPAAEVTRRLGIDVRPALAHTTRPGPPAPSGLLDRHAMTGGRAAGSAPPAGEGPADRRLADRTPPRASGPSPVHGSRDPREAAGPRTAPEEPDRRRPSRRERPDAHGAVAGHPRDRRPAGTERTGRHPDGEPRAFDDRPAARVDAARAVEPGEGRPPGARPGHGGRGTPEGRARGMRPVPLEAPDQRRGSDRWDERRPEARPDDAAIEAAMQRVLTDAARRYGIEV